MNRAMNYLGLRGSNTHRERVPPLKASARDSYEGLEDDDVKPIEEKKKFGAYSWFILLVAVLIKVIIQWHRSFFSYAYGYTGVGDLAGSAFYEISSSFPQLKTYYGMLTGLAYTVPFATFGLFVGKLTDTVSRKWALAAVLALAGGSIGLSGITDSFLVLAAMRVVHGMLNSACNPFSFSLISDYFPPDKRATANSMIHSG